MRPHVQGGKVKVIAITNSERAPMIPDVPTAKEAGHPALGIDGLIGLFGLKGMPDDLRNRIAADLKEAASDPDIVAKITATGQIVRPGGAEEFAKEIEVQSSVVSKAAAAAGVKRMLQN
jgi:tripartite-type tricarboxylate transporter receptor subunit TctC